MLGWAYLVAAVILAVATAANLAGLKAGARLQLTLAGAVAAALVVTVAISVPHMRVDNLTPFAPHGIAPIGSAVIVLFFAFAGWEAVGHLVGECRDADRDVPKAVATTIIVVTVLYVGTAAAVVLTGTYGSPAVDRVAIGRLLQSSLGSNAGVAAALIAVIISLGTTNAFVAGSPAWATPLAATAGCPDQSAASPPAVSHAAESCSSRRSRTAGSASPRSAAGAPKHCS